MEDTEIIDLYWQRDQRAIDETHGKYGGFLAGIAWNILRSHSDAEECVNDTWLHAWNGMPPHRPNVLRLFLAKITRRVALNRWKASQPQKRGQGELPLVLEELAQCLAQEGDPVTDAAVARELGECVRAFVRALQPREGDLFARRYFFTEPLEDIAGAWGLSVNHPAVPLYRARQKLKDHLAKEGYL